MKFREPIQRYEVGKHGSEYIDYSGPAMICPECQSDNVRKIEPYKGDRNGDYLCEDCGCEFDTWIGAELTGFGKFVDKFTKVMAYIFGISAGICLIAGLIYLLYLDHIYGNGNIPDDLRWTCLAIAVGGTLTLVVFSCVANAINEKI